MPNGIYGPSLQTVEISTGNVATVNDTYDATLVNNGAKNQLGACVYLTDSSGRTLKYRYVRLSGTGTASTSNTPGIVYWKDNTFTVVTPTMSEAVFNGANAVAGWILNTSATNGNFIFIQVAGYLASAFVAASTAVGDAEIGGGAAFVPVRVAAATAPTNKVAAWALTAISSSKSDVLVALES